MGYKTKISWTDATWNPWVGCQKVSAGCLHCYAETMSKRFGVDFRLVRRTSPATFNAPLKWKGPKRVFTCSMSDFFIRLADEWRDEAWGIIERTPGLTYLILTKRPENILGRLPAKILPNVWLGVTIENESVLDDRLGNLMAAGVGYRKFVSIEPMLDEIRPKMLDLYPIDWIIVGGESGPGSRPMRSYWAAKIISYSLHRQIPVFFKQTGNVLAHILGLRSRAGSDPSEWLDGFKVQQFPPEVHPESEEE